MAGELWVSFGLYTPCAEVTEVEVLTLAFMWVLGNPTYALMARILSKEPSSPQPLSSLYNGKSYIELMGGYLKFLSINLMRKKEVLPKCSFLLLCEELCHSEILLFWEFAVRWDLSS